MGVFDKLKDAISEKLNETPVIKATMMGPRGVGKTSVMASIFGDTRDNIAGTGLFFRPSHNSSAELYNKRLSLMNIFDKRINITDAPQAGVIAASNDVTSFSFEMGRSGRAKSIDIEIKDFPGEFLVSRPDEVSNYIAESHIVMVAIDSPYLMEDDGRYNEEKNNVKGVTEFFTNHFESIQNKLILLVPLKCERYFHDGKIDVLKKKIESTYSTLTKFCEESNIACVIAPIQTLGGVEFDKFTNYNSTNNYNNVSKISEYRFYEKSPKYEPMFSVQPFYYLLTYAVNYYEWSNNQHRDFFESLKNSLVSVLKNDKDFFLEIKRLSKNILINKMGYAIIVNNNILKLNK